MNAATSILIAGGYGVVGRQLAMLIRQCRPDLPLIIAGRNLAKAEALAIELDHASALQLDVEQSNPLQGAQPRAIVALVNDPHDYLLMDAVQNGIPYLDVARWSERLRESISRLSTETVSAPVMFTSGWMGGIAALMAVAAARTLQKTEQIDIGVLFSLKDKSGPNSIEYMDRLATPFETLTDGQPQQVFPYTDSRRVKFSGGFTTPVYRFDTPDQLTLPQATGAKTVATRIAFDDIFSTQLLRVLIRSGLWKLISGDRFTQLRQSLLYNPGSGASHEIDVAVDGSDTNGFSKTVTATIVDPQGQTHLTALGALIQLERLLGLDGANPPAPGIVYPDTAPQIEHALYLLEQFGVTVSFQSLPKGILEDSSVTPFIGAAPFVSQRCQ
ncbi:saccharopine dehydrogenase [Acaryochloris sp. IP29b_bin.137]|uniref:saccharopine dehydrogenase family protein n=1 Tax=Acaryochloris sp. IP29b_bin.137 TaxID=2969217 RepID=UPI0026068C54|nr:saccharopine dehydrogenase [Acaryochloris sp. IP29b_bin.137]